MLGKSISFDIQVNDKIYKYTMNFKLLNNLYELTKRNPFDILNELIAKETEEERRRELISQIIIAGANAEIDIEDIADIMDKIEQEAFAYMITVILLEETKSEFPKDDEDENKEVKREDKELTELEKAKNWINFYNEAYYNCLYQLRMSKQEFEELTIREYKTLIDYHEAFYKNEIIRAYIDITKARNNGDKKTAEAVKKENVATAENGIRIGNLLSGAFKNN